MRCLQGFSEILTDARLLLLLLTPACVLFSSTPLPPSFQNSRLCRLLCPCGCAYLAAHQLKTTLMYISPPPLKGDESSAIRHAGEVKSGRAVVHVCLHLRSCFFIDPSGS